jgi:hypothetical protein
MMSFPAQRLWRGLSLQFRSGTTYNSRHPSIRQHHQLKSVHILNLPEATVTVTQLATDMVRRYCERSVGDGATPADQADFQHIFQTLNIARPSSPGFVRSAGKVRRIPTPGFFECDRANNRAYRPIADALLPLTRAATLVVALTTGSVGALDAASAFAQAAAAPASWSTGAQPGEASQVILPRAVLRRVEVFPGWSPGHLYTSAFALAIGHFVNL